MDGLASGKEVDQSFLSLSCRGLYFVHVRHRTLLSGLDWTDTARQAGVRARVGAPTRLCLKAGVIAICQRRLLWSMSRGQPDCRRKPGPETRPEPGGKGVVLISQMQRLRRWAACWRIDGGSPQQRARTDTDSAQPQTPFSNRGRTAARRPGLRELHCTALSPARRGAWSSFRVLCVPERGGGGRTGVQGGSLGSSELGASRRLAADLPLTQSRSTAATSNVCDRSRRSGKCRVRAGTADRNRRHSPWIYRRADLAEIWYNQRGKARDLKLAASLRPSNSMPICCPAVARTRNDVSPSARLKQGRQQQPGCQNALHDLRTLQFVRAASLVV